MSTEISAQRTKNYFKQLKGSFVFKALAVLSSLILIPIMIKYLGNEQYGIWSTLLSLVSWIVLFDIGIGSGLRNKIAESLAKDNILDAQKYISTSYVLIGVISLILLLVFQYISSLIPWQTVFNTQVLLESDLKNIVNITATFILINFWISLINQVFNGLQKSSLVVFNQFLSNLFSLALVYLLSIFTETSLLYLTLVYGMSLISSSAVLSIWFYKNNLNLLPRLSLYNKKFVSSITSLGFKFFIIQIAVIVIFTTDKILITQWFGPEYVTNYDVVFKLFSIITIAHSILMTPLWSAYGDAYHREDFEWIQRTLKSQLKIFILFIVATITLIIVAKPMILLWIGDGVEVDIMLVLSMALFVLISIWNNIFGYLLGGISFIRLGSYYTLITAFVNIPLSYFYAVVLDYGLSGIMYGTISSILISALISPIQVYYFIFTDSRNELFTRILK